MNDGPRYATFRDYLRVVRERRVLIVLMTLAFGAGALGWSIRQQDVYSTEASMEFKDINVESAGLGSVIPDRQTPEQRAAISAQNATRREVAERASKDLGGRVPPQVLQGITVARPESRTNLVVISVRWKDPRAAANIADAMATAARDLGNEEARERFKDLADSKEDVLDELEDTPASRQLRIIRLDEIARLRELSKTVRPVEILRTASVPRSPVSPKPILNTLLGLLLGLVVGLVAAFARDSLDRRFKNAREITAELHLPLVGYLREDVLGRSIVGNGRKALTGDELEGFRILRTNVEFLDVDHPPKLILVTSALPEEGKSTVASALACAYAAAGKRTLLIDCDLRRPTLAQKMGLNTTPGLTDYLIGNAGPGDVLQTIKLSPETTGNGAGPTPAASEMAPLVCIAAGTTSPQPAETLGSERFKAFIAQVREVYDTVILDSAPVLSVVDTLELLPHSDAVVVCVRASQTTRDQARAAKSALDHFPARPTGIVVTGVRARDAGDAYGYYSYGYVYGSEHR